MIREFGVTAWGRDWRRLAEAATVTRPNAALPRARALSGNDQIHDLHLTAGAITATVDDREPRHVKIQLATWNETQHRQATTLLQAHTATDDLPDSVHAALRDVGLHLAPDPLTTASECDCRTRSRPCAHIFAVYYEMARRLDERPRLALDLRHAESPRTNEPTSRTPLALIDPTNFYGSHHQSRKPKAGSGGRRNNG